MAVAPSSFGPLAGKLLIGNFGNGRINAYRQVGNRVVLAGPLRDSNNKPISIDGLWSLNFGNGGKAGNTNTLYFTAGPNGEKDGLLGTITPILPQA
jgi:uncharacterized protein (TIGR03118 family)